jgi:hypothetical protein
MWHSHQFKHLNLLTFAQYLLQLWKLKLLLYSYVSKLGKLYHASYVTIQNWFKQVRAEFEMEENFSMTKFFFPYYYAKDEI